MNNFIFVQWTDLRDYWLNVESYLRHLKGRFPKLKEGIYNIRADSLDITNILSHSADSDILVVAKLKLKLSYCGQLYFGIVHPESILH